VRPIDRPALAFCVLCLFAFVSARAEATEPEHLAVKVPSQDLLMKAAFAQAHATLDDFLAKLSHPPEGTERYAVKIGIKDAPAGGIAIVPPGGEDLTEYFWIGGIQADGDGFTGFVHNDPALIRNVSFDQKIRFGRDDVADWVYFERGKMKGNFSACPVLAHSPRAMAEMHEKLGLTCD
jgi:uncharacterized protein YegJ (DUF2314 family)